jgi:hypothetical protein
MRTLADQQTRLPYTPPSVTYHGRVGELTLSQHLVTGTKVLQFAAAFAASLGTVTPGGGETTPVVPPGTPLGPGEVQHGVGTGFDIPPSGGGGSVPTALGGGGDPSGGSVASGAGSGGGGAGGKLPFTGLAVMGVAAVGAALASAGAVMRRATRRGARDAS